MYIISRRFISGGKSPRSWRQGRKRDDVDEAIERLAWMVGGGFLCFVGVSVLGDWSSILV